MVIICLPVYNQHPHLSFGIVDSGNRGLGCEFRQWELLIEHLITAHNMGTVTMHFVATK